jgi:hypothetical protein
MEKKVGALRMKYLLPIIVMACVVAGVVFANGLGGQRLEKVVGDLIVDVGTDQTSTPVAGKVVEFDFNLLKSDTRKPVGTTSVGIDIEHDGGMSMVDCDIITQPTITSFFYTFPEGGDYSLKVSFFDKDRVLATASFPLAILGSEGKMRALYIGALLVCIFFGALGGYWAALKRSYR